MQCFQGPKVAGDSVTAEPTANTDTPVHCTPVQAWQQNKLSCGFSGGGFLLPYHLGCYQSLAAMGIVSPTETPMAGSSAGSLVVSGIKAGLSVQQQMDSFLEAAHNCRQTGVQGRLRSVLHQQLEKTMPEDAAERCSDGTCWISVTQAFPRPCNKLYGAFSSRKALIKALLASCHLPRLSDGSIFTAGHKSAHKRVMDGGFSNLCPVPPVPHAAVEGVASGTAAVPDPAKTTTSTTSNSSTTSSTAAGDANTEPPRPTAPASALLHLQRADSTKGITTRLVMMTAQKPNKPSAGPSTSSSSSNRGHGHHAGVVVGRSMGAPERPAHSAAPHQHGSSNVGHGRGLRVASWGLWGGSQKRLQQQQAEQVLAASCEVAGAGAYVSAEGWFAVRVCVLPARHMHELPTMFKAPAADEVSIALDMFQDWPHDLNATTNLALVPQSDDFLWDLFRRGQQDAASWARQQGFPPHVLQRVAEGAAEAPHLRVVRPPPSSDSVSGGGGGGVEGGEEQQREQQEEEVMAAAAAAQGVEQAERAIKEQQL